MGAKIVKDKSELWSIEEFNKELNKLKKELVYTDTWANEEGIEGLDIYNIFINKSSSRVLESTLELNFDWIPKQLGLRVGGFSILNTYTGYQVLLENKEISDKKSSFYPKIDFLSNEPEDSNREAISKKQSAAIDALFIGKRSKQGFSSDLEIPEFYAHIGNKNKNNNAALNDKIISKTENWKGLKDDTDFLYCPVGEVLFYIYAWRLYIKKDIIELDIKEKSIEKYFSKYFSIDLTEYQSETHDFLDEFNQFYEYDQNRPWNTEEEWDILGLQKRSENKIEFSPSTYKIIEFAIHFEEHSLPNGKLSFQSQLSRLKEDFSTNDNFSIFLEADPAKKFQEYWHGYIVNVITKYNELSSKELIKDARFPIAAYFFQYFIQKGDKYPIAHFAFPIWTTTTPDYVLKKTDFNKANPIIIVGLFTVQPVWSVYNNFEHPYFQSSFSNFENINNPQYRIFDRIRLLVNELIKGVVEKGFYRNIALKDILSKSRRAAISQVLARNLSHNIGSHVLSRLASEETLNNIFIKDTIRHNQLYYEYKSLVLPPNPTTTEEESFEASIKIFKQLSIFNSYLKSFMDYVADVATTSPTVEVSKLFVKDIFMGFAQNLIMRNLISGVNDFNYHFDIIINEKKRMLTKDESMEWKATVDNGFEDVLISVPNDILGCHALYVLIKNIIRNTAKHGKQRDVTFTINLNEFTNGEDGDNRFYKVQIYDNVLINDIETFVEGQNKQISESIINDRNELRLGGWGMIEMEVSSAYLRKIPIEAIDDLEYNLTINGTNDNDLRKKKSLTLLEAIPVKQNVDDQAGNLGYQFFLMKPKDLMILDENNDSSSEITNIDRDAYLNKGILALNTNGSSKWVYDSKRNDPHPILLYIAKSFVDQKEVKKFIKNTEASLPHRIIVVVDDHLVPCKPERQVAFISRTTYKKEITKFFTADSHYELLKKAVWRVWLLNRYAFLGIKSIDYVRINQNSEDYFEVSSFSKKFKVELDYHDFRKNTTNLSHYEAYPSYVKPWIDLSKGSSKYPKPLVYYAFLDSFAQSVIILDERIQEASNNLIYEIPLKEHLQKANIFIPESANLSLSETNFSNLYQGLKSWIEDFASFKSENARENNVPIIPGIDFLVVHLGIVEKLIDAANDFPDKSKSEKNISLFINHYFGEARDYKIIIESGRGKPSNLPPELPYLNYSIVSQYCLDQKLKYLLVNALSSARKHIES